MDAPTRQLIESIHGAPYRCVVALTGGGTLAAGQLLLVSGGSRTVLECIIPYGEAALVEFLGHRPEQFCSAQTSIAMARRAYERARWLAGGVPVCGLGGTASLATDRPKHGDHRFHVSCWRSDKTWTYSLILNKGSRGRAGEEAVLDRIILNALARAFQIEQQLEVALLPPESIGLEERHHQGPRTLFEGRTGAVWVTPEGQWQEFTAERKVRAVLPGSFNPVHEGHWALASVAEKLLQTKRGQEPFSATDDKVSRRRRKRFLTPSCGTVVFELSIDNVDKPSLPEEEVRRRLAQFQWRAPVVLTRAATFTNKASLFAGATFLVGADTASRIIARRYYESEPALTAALRHIREQGCSFLVAGRVDAGGKYLELNDLGVPAEFRDLFRGIPASAFRMDISSTQLRDHAAQEKARPA